MPTSRHASSAICANTSRTASRALPSPHSSCCRWRRSSGKSNTWASRSGQSSRHRCVSPRHRWKFGFKIVAPRPSGCRRRKSRRSKWPPWGEGRRVHSGPWPVTFIRVWCIWDKWRPGWCALVSPNTRPQTNRHTYKHNQIATPHSIVVTRNIKTQNREKTPKFCCDVKRILIYDTSKCCFKMHSVNTVSITRERERERRSVSRLCKYIEKRENVS